METGAPGQQPALDGSDGRCDAWPRRLHMRVEISSRQLGFISKRRYMAANDSSWGIPSR